MTSGTVHLREQLLALHRAERIVVERTFGGVGDDVRAGLQRRLRHEGDWRLGNITLDSWAEIARRQRRYNFASKKTLAHPDCQVCEYQSICHGGCPKFRHGPFRRFSDLDYFCTAYKMIFGKSVTPLRNDLKKLALIQS